MLLLLLQVSMRLCGAKYAHDFARLQTGSLDDALNNTRPDKYNGGLRPDWRARTRIAAEVASALLHLHGLGLTHGRLQPSTVLLERGLTAKLGDSGLHRCGGLDPVTTAAIVALHLHQ